MSETATNIPEGRAICVPCAGNGYLPKQADPKPLVTIEDFVREYARLDAESTRLEEEKKKVDAERGVVEIQIMEKYAMEGMNSTKIAGLGSFPMTTKTYASIKAEAKAEAIALFKKHYPDLVQETINAQTLSGFVSNSQKNDIVLPEELLATLNVFKKGYISWKK